MKVKLHKKLVGKRIHFCFTQIKNEVNFENELHILGKENILFYYCIFVYVNLH